MAIYDLCYKNIQSDHAKKTLITKGKINWKFLGARLGLGALFLLVINAGVCYSNSFYNTIIIYINTIIYKIIAVVVSFLVSTVFSMF